MISHYKNAKAAHLRLGLRGENIACRLLRKKKYDILVRNFKCPNGEIDIVARDGENLVFIEVKSRMKSSRGRPAEGLRTEQKKRIMNAAKTFLHQIGSPDVVYRFDLIELVFSRRNPVEIRHWTEHIRSKENGSKRR